MEAIMLILILIFYYLGFLSCLLTMKFYKKYFVSELNRNTLEKTFSIPSKDVENVSKDLMNEWFYGVGGGE